MKILVTNDDGIYAEGIKELAITLSKVGEVVIVAPDRERSGTGHAITVHHPLRLEEIKLPNVNLKAYSVNGTPSDCVKLAVEALLPKKPDIIFSGINRGPNLGTDVIYSGTVSAAVEGAILGIPSVAVSLAAYENVKYGIAAEFALKTAKKIIESGLETDTILNINVPSVEKDDIMGVSVTTLGVRRYTNTFEKRIDPRGKVYYWLAGEVIEDNLDINTDVGAVKNNYISITPIHFDLTKFELLEKIKKWNLSL
ncbi:MAG: 5/3-nucleotidase [Thermosediminibacterales bacterium]|nr:5/3-nucleotidase [Thermosediminibacterales bacterium]MDK2835989.1 5/3-nucleotidase [Thermosediminibacterales bacterium]